MRNIIHGNRGWLSLLLALSACGTIDSQVRYWSPEPGEKGVPWVLYGGVARDYDWARLMVAGDRWSNPEIFVLLPAWLVELPLSILADTALLPMTVVQQVLAWIG